MNGIARLAALALAFALLVTSDRRVLRGQAYRITEDDLCWDFDEECW